MLRFLFLFLVWGVININASAFIVNNISYTKTDSINREVSVNGCSSSITELLIPSNITYGGIEYSVKSIGRRAFYVEDLNWPRSLNSITLSEGITSIEGEAFSDCNYLSSVYLPRSLETIGYRAFWRCSKLTSLKFYGSTIGIEAFQGCRGLVSIEFSANLTTIGKGAFSLCEKLPKLELPNSLIDIQSSAFSGCSKLSTIQWPQNVNNVEEKVFEDCVSLVSLELPEGLSSIGASAFQNCTNLTFLELPESLTSIGSRAFSGCKELASIKLPENVKIINDYTFDGCESLSSIVISENLDSIKNYAFQGCNSLSSFDIPHKVKYIGASSFNKCSNLSFIKIPSSMSKIGNYAFNSCTNLVIVKSEIEKPFVIPDDVFRTIASDAKLQVPRGTLELYNGSPSWSKSFATIEEYTITLSDNNTNYSVVSENDKTINVANGKYGMQLIVPASITFDNEEWKIVGVDDDAFDNSNELAVIIWNPETVFNGNIVNPNLLLYVKNKDYSGNVKNAIVDGVAEEIVLQDMATDNNFYCPQAFTANKISYEHNYSMKTDLNICRGWETIALPFDVYKVLNKSGEELVPYSNWTIGSSQRPFWLYSLSDDGWKAESSIKANTPYIISMPNNEYYDAVYNQSGNIVFSATNVKVESSENLTISKSNHKNLVPNYQNQESSNDIYALNVNNLWDKNTESDMAEGSAFIRGLRQVRPFEAYMTIDSGGSATRSISIFDDGNTTGIMDIPTFENGDEVKVYSLSGALLKQGKYDELIKNLPKGIYIINNKKVVIK